MSGASSLEPNAQGILTGLQIARNAIRDPEQRAKVGGGLGWETAEDVVERLLRLAEQGKLFDEISG